MAKTARIKGIAFSVDTQVSAPRRRFGLPCYDVDSCEVPFCKESDRYEDGFDTALTMLRGITPKKRLIRECVNLDCERRINVRGVPIETCKDCEHISVQAGVRLYHIPPTANCRRGIAEARQHRRPKPFGRDRRLFHRGGEDHWYGGHVV